MSFSEGGTTTNTVPATAFLTIDVRARTQTEQDRVHSAMLALLPTVPGAVLTVLGGPNRPPMELTSSAALFDRATIILAGGRETDGAELLGIWRARIVLYACGTPRTKHSAPRAR